MPDVYSRQNLIRDLKVPDTATVVGCGGTGFWTAMFLAMSGVKHLVLIDPDVIEESNRNRLLVTNASVGGKKVRILKEYIVLFRPDCMVEALDTVVVDENVNIIRGSVFCCTDNLRSQQLLCAYCRKNGFNYQRIGYDGTILNVSRAFPLTFKDDLDEGGYTETPSWVVPAVAAAALGVFSQVKSEIAVMDELGKIGILDSSFIPPVLRDKISADAEYVLKHNGWKDCGECSKSSCDDCERGDCETCGRPSNSSYEEMESDLEDAREERNTLREKVGELKNAVLELKEKVKKLNEELNEERE